jgi:hypothetical protein
MAIRWQPVRRVRLEAAGAVADVPGAPLPGVRSSLLPADRGRGFALRGQVRSDHGLVVRALVHQGTGGPARGEGETVRRRLVDLQVEKNLGRGLRAAGRLRRSSRNSWVFDVRLPWLPPTVETSRLQTVYSLSVVRDADPWRTTFLIRSLGQETPDRPGRRSLLAVTARRRSPGGWRLRLFATTAWGDEVDLVSAVVPLDGLILPRHWGRWRSGVGVGTGWRSRRFGWELALGVRRPEPGRGERTDPWLRMAVQGGL